MARSRKRLSARSGKLTGRARRERLGRLKEGEVALLASGDALKKGKKKGIWAEWGVSNHATALIDARRMVRMVELDLAQQFSEDLDAQRRPDTGRVYYKWDGKLRTARKGVAVAGETDADREYFRRTGGRIDPRRGIQSGRTMETWWISKVSGSTIRASGKLRPSKSGFIIAQFNELKRRGYVFQSVRGRAAKTIQGAVERYQSIMVNPPNDIPVRPDIGETDLVKSRGK